MLRTLFLVYITSQLYNAVDCEKMEVVNQWSFFNMDFPMGKGFERNYRPENTFFTGIEVTEDRIFLALPRLWNGVPSTLNVIPRKTPPGSSPALQAYPDWSFHRAALREVDCNGLVSVYRMRLDSCNRLWVLDSGIMNSLEEFQRICRPKIVIFDLSTDTVVRTVELPDEVLRPHSVLSNILIDETKGLCDNAFAYMADTVASGLIVYNSGNGTTWRVSHPMMFPNPDHSSATIAGETFTLLDAIGGLALSPSYQILYFQPLASDRIFGIPADVLRRGPLGENEELPVATLRTKSSQALGLALDPKDETVYFSPVAETALVEWQPANARDRIVAYDPETLQFPGEILYASRDNGNIWLLTTRFQKFIRRTVQGNETNLRVIRIQKNDKTFYSNWPHSYNF